MDSWRSQVHVALALTSQVVVILDADAQESCGARCGAYIDR